MHECPKTLNFESTLIRPTDPEIRQKSPAGGGGGGNYHICWYGMCHFLECHF